ncbi:hypothetical protein NDU88_003553 [Pleurodeles waltl]|uniref:Uncharacterized protein n=1 Tax=Pleurodeles waltl TaxID=8319 RepID=A0AAV7QDE0_PLEWA|nr:hypothetical protein NDU88_003553 [Pleurodeles waltl]
MPELGSGAGPGSAGQEMTRGERLGREPRSAHEDKGTDRGVSSKEFQKAVMPSEGTGKRRRQFRDRFYGCRIPAG